MGKTKTVSLGCRVSGEFPLPFSSIFIFPFPFTIFHIRYLHLQLDSLLITCAHTFCEGRATAAATADPQTDPPRIDPELRRRRWRWERFVCKCSLCKSARTHDRFFFSFFPLPLLFIMNYWTIGSLSKYKLSNKFERGSPSSGVRINVSRTPWLSSSATSIRVSFSYLFFYFPLSWLSPPAPTWLSTYDMTQSKCKQHSDAITR